MFFLLENWKFSLPSSSEAEPDVIFQGRKQPDMSTLVLESGDWAKLKALLLYYIRDAVKKNDEKIVGRELDSLEKKGVW